MKKALVLVSGGIDSAAALWWARERYLVTALSYDGADRPRGEVRACVAIAEHVGVPLLRVAAPYLQQHPSGYIPARNLVIHSIALSVAETRGASVVVAGHNRSDAKVFEDARTAFFRRLERLNGGVKIVLPFAGKSDAEVIALALRWRVPLELTWSCYRDGARPCRRCSACRGRIESFRQINSEDPA
jgi:7-cyano-7-deazaguanine synthase